MKLLFACFFLIGIFKVPFITSEPPRWRAGHTYPQPLPQDIMVDAVNYIGLIILHAHNQNNENNIAFSPYGATSVLVALGEGVQGIALDEILRATLLPLDISITRVGLRDIHRHLKSYFIPQEGFLAGLTFSHENVTLKSSYEDILRFYGYDVNSFNNALYPDPNTVTTSSTSSTVPTNPANTASTTTQTTPVVTIEDKDEFNSSITASVPPSTLVPESTVTTTSNTETTQVETITTTPPTTTTVVSSTPTIPTTTAIPVTTQTTTETPTTTSTRITSIQTTTTSTSQPTTTESATSSIAITIDTTITTSPDSTTTSTTVPPTTVDQNLVTETVTTNIPLSTTQGTRPTAVTINIVPSTVGNADTTSTSSSTTATMITQLDNTGPVVINVQPTTLSSSAVENTTIVDNSTPSSTTETTDTDNTAADSTLMSTTENTAITVDVTPTTRGSQNAESTTTATTETTVTDNTAADSTLMSTTENTAITVDVTPTTRGSQNAESTTTATTIDSTITSVAEGTATIVSVIPTTRTPQNTESTATTDTTLMSTTENAAITIDIMPTTRSSQNSRNTATNENITERPTPTLITPSGSDLLTGLEVDVQPTTLGPRTANIIENKTAESETNTMPSRKPRRKSLPRFRDDVDLVNMLKTENKSAQSQNNPRTNRTVISANTKVTSIENKTEVLRSSIMLSKTGGTNEPKNITTEVNDLSSSTVIKETSTSTELTDTTNDDIIKASKELDSIVEESSDDDELVSSTSEEGTYSGTEESFVATENIKLRGTRSVIDYLIARYHDNNPSHSYMSSATGYEPTKPTTFAVNGKIREPNINFMTYDTVLPYRYISHLNALALTFPLDSTRYYLLLVLPIDEMGIDNLVSNMMSTTLKQIIYSLQPTRVKATIPSFMLKGYVVLTPTLQKLGIRQIFEPRRADFSRMTDDKDIYVTNIEQAVTVTIRNYVDPNTLQNDNRNFRRRGPVQFTADHPFLYFVMDSQIHVALMAGKIINPLNSRIR